ncbi:MAG: stage III sporulation protein AE [Eubacteriales bacterium]|nr:stage III sporulation protein AE [Eubacteriales bacterium]
MKRLVLLFAGLLLGLLLSPAGTVYAGEEPLESELLGEMDLTGVQALLDEILEEDSFSFRDAVKGLMEGREIFSKEAVGGFLQALFFDRVQRERDDFFRILLLILAAALFSSFSAAFEDGQLGEISFFMVYLLLFTMLMNTFGELSASLEEKLGWMTELMKGLTPAYFMAVAASAGAATAAVFYQGILLLVWLIQWILLTFLLPAVNLCVLLRLINHLSREDMLSKMAELLETGIGWGLKSLLGLVAGLQIVKGLVAPVMDSLKRTALGKTAGAIPGVGNAVNLVTELVVTSAVLVRNSLGAVSLFALAVMGLEPLLHYGLLSLSYRFLGALAQPVSDKRLVGCLSTMGEGCAMLLRILLTGEVLCMLTFVILASSLGGGG